MRNRNFKDAQKQVISPKSQVLFHRLEKQQFFSDVEDEGATQIRILALIKNVISILELRSGIYDEVEYYYRKILRNNEYIRNHVTLIAFCLYHATKIRKKNAPVSIIEITKVFFDLGHGKTTAKLIMKTGLLYKLPFVEPKRCEDYIEKMLSQIMKHPNLKKRLEWKRFRWNEEKYRIKLQIQTKKVLESIPDIMRRGRKPKNMAAGAIYFADKRLFGILTQEFVSFSTNVPAFSISDQYSYIKRYVGGN